MERYKGGVNMKDIITLAVESSCDETSVAVLKNGREVLSNIINTQVDVHKKFGGVVPEVASRKHIENIDVVLQEALDKANITLNDIESYSCNLWSRSCWCIISWIITC